MCAVGGVIGIMSVVCYPLAQADPGLMLQRKCPWAGPRTAFVVSGHRLLFVSIRLGRRIARPHCALRYE